MDVIAGVNPWTTGRSVEQGGAGDSGVLTAVGVHAAMTACAQRAWGAPSLARRRIGIEGVGQVGARLAGLALDEGARVLVADVDDAALGRLQQLHPQVEVCPREELLAADLDVLAPCALGGTLTRDVIGRLRADVVCGGANNQLAEPGLDTVLAERGILYAPEFVANAGGVIAVSDEYVGFDPERALARTRRIATTMTQVLARADESGVTPWAAAERLAQDRVDAAAAAQPPYGTFPVPGTAT
jgi:valine dehydrogenase (NAD+)